MAIRFREVRKLQKKVRARYKQHDPGHDCRHHDAVVSNTRVLGGRHGTPRDVELAEIAATYHDSALVDGREGHEHRAAMEVMTDPTLAKYYTAGERFIISRAVMNHRASNGTPMDIVSKIVADADRTPTSTGHAFMRAFEHGLLNHPQLTHEQQLRRAAKHLFEKYGPDGYGRRVHFPETDRAIAEVMGPIFEAHLTDNLELMQAILDLEYRPPKRWVAAALDWVFMAWLIAAVPLFVLLSISAFHYSFEVAAVWAAAALATGGIVSFAAGFLCLWGSGTMHRRIMETRRAGYRATA